MLCVDIGRRMDDRPQVNGRKGGEGWIAKKTQTRERGRETERQKLIRSAREIKVGSTMRKLHYFILGCQGLARAGFKILTIFLDKLRNCKTKTM